MGTPRTRSTFFSFAIQLHLNLHDYSEIYDIQNFDKFRIDQYLKVSKEKDSDKRKALIHQFFTENHKNTTQRIFQKNIDYCLKFWTRNLVTKFDKKETNMWHPGLVLDEGGSRYILDLNSYDPHIVTNLTEIFNLQQYSKYYFLSRDPTDTIASLSYAMENKHFNMVAWNHKTAQRTLEQFIREGGPKPYTVNYDTPRIRWYIFELALCSLLEKYLIEHNLNYTKLDYHEIPDYVQKTYPYDREKYSGTRWDILPNYWTYPEVITNYQELKIFVEKYYQQCLARIDELGIKFI